MCKNAQGSLGHHCLKYQNIENTKYMSTRHKVMIHLCTEYHALTEQNKTDLVLTREDTKNKLQSSTYDYIFVKQTHISNIFHVPLWIDKI